MNAFTDRLISLGREYDEAMRQHSLESCNCMVRYGGGDQIPAIRRGKEFTTPEGRPITTPDSYKDMRWQDIVALLKQRGETYIGHMFAPPP